VNHSISVSSTDMLGGRAPRNRICQTSCVMRRSGSRISSTCVSVLPHTVHHHYWSLCRRRYCRSNDPLVGRFAKIGVPDMTPTGTGQRWKRRNWAKRPIVFGRPIAHGNSRLRKALCSCKESAKALVVGQHRCTKAPRMSPPRCGICTLMVTTYRPRFQMVPGR
jgi:hypothetical protein